MSKIYGENIIENVETVAAFCRGVRNFLNMSQNDFADWIGVARGTLIRIEQAKPPLSYGVLVTIVKNFREIGITSEAINGILLGIKDSVDAMDINIDFQKLNKNKLKEKNT